MKVYERLSQCGNAWYNSLIAKNEEWVSKWEDEIDKIVKDYMPHGSGIDGKTIFKYVDKPFDDRMTLISSYHAMDDNGMYDKWINFRVTIKPSLQFGIKIDIKGNFGNYQHCKEYILKQFHNALMSEYTSNDETEKRLTVARGFYGVSKHPVYYLHYHNGGHIPTYEVLNSKTDIGLTETILRAIEMGYKIDYDKSNGWSDERVGL